MDGATMALGEEQVAAAWDANAATWVEHVRAGYDLYREAFTMPAFLAFIPDLGGLRVIDLGCGEGHNTRALARRGAKITGVDLAPRMIAAARANEAAEPLGIIYQVGSFAGLEFCEDASFDAAVSTMALRDGPDFAAAARAVHRVLRPGGGFHFSVLHPCFVTAARSGCATGAGARPISRSPATSQTGPTSSTGGSRRRRRPAAPSRFGCRASASAWKTT
jgi:SAM-dependent methyltransferase